MSVRSLDALVEELCGDLTSIRAPRGTQLNARSWQTEAPLRMLLNNLDAEVAEHPERLVVYGGTGRAARSHDALRAIVRTLLRLGDDETLLVQSGKPVGVFRTTEAAPRVLIANALLVPRWATWDEFRRLEALGLTMFGQMTAGSWIYIGTQGILQGTYQTFGAAGAARRPLAVGLPGTAAEVVPELAGRGEHFDLVTDQTAAHDPRTGYTPAGLSVEEAGALRSSAPEEYLSRARASIATHVSGLLELARQGSYVFDYGNNLRGEAQEAGVDEAFTYPGFVPAYIRPLFCRGVGPFRWAALSGDPEDIFRTDAKVKELMPDDKHLHNWLDMARARIKFQGLPARICWVGLGDRHRLGLAFNEMVARGELKAPIVIGRDHLDSGSVASPNRETEAMQDGSDAVSDWPLLNALLNTASGATWVSLHHGGGVGMGYSQHAGMVIVADGTDDAARRLERVLWNDPATGVMRHADAGYEEAIACAREQGLDLPGIL